MSDKEAARLGVRKSDLIIMFGRVLGAGEAALRANLLECDDAITRMADAIEDALTDAVQKQLPGENADGGGEERAP